jgi:S-adenosylmethionine:tRNA ribosyltransferase-isomerase
MLPTADLDYHLPQELIATRPLAERANARLLVTGRGANASVAHKQVRDLPDLLAPGDLLVVNVTKVVPARFRGERRDTGGRVEGLFLEARPTGDWLVLLKSNGKLRSGQEVELHGAGGDLALRLHERAGDAWLVESLSDGDALALLDRVGRTPLPPYILRARKAQRERGELSDDEMATDELDRAWYQTVYADDAAAGAVAAPTAGLHFTPELLAELRRRGVQRAEIVLQVGAGTFKPVETQHVEEHPMHSERFLVRREVMRRIVDTRRAGGRVIAVGTTTARALESLPSLEADRDIAASTDLLITPGYEFRHIDGLLTNFHLPRSTLLAMVGAFLEGGVPRLLRIYEEAIRERYRFYSYGDAMLLLPGEEGT